MKRAVGWGSSCRNSSVRREFPCKSPPDSLLWRTVIRSARDADGGGHAAARAVERARRSIPVEARPDHRHEAPADPARRSDRLAADRPQARRFVHGWPRSAAAANAPDGRPRDPQAYAQPVGRGAHAALGREPVLPALLRRGVLPSRGAIRSLLDEPLAPADG